MLRKKEESRAPELWLAADRIALPSQTNFYARLKDVLDGMDFGSQVRALCEPYYSTKSNVRPPIDPEVYFKMSMAGFFENIGAPEAETITADKGYRKASEITALQALRLRTVIPGRRQKRVRGNYTNQEWAAIERAEEAVRQTEGKELLRKRGQHIELSFAHVLDSGGGRRTTLRRTPNIQKRRLAATLVYNLSPLMRVKTGKGTPKQWAATIENAIRAIHNDGRWLPQRPGTKNNQTILPYQQTSTGRIIIPIKTKQWRKAAFSTDC